MSNSYTQFFLSNDIAKRKKKDKPTGEGKKKSRKWENQAFKQNFHQVEQQLCNPRFPMYGCQYWYPILAVIILITELRIFQLKILFSNILNFSEFSENS